MRARDLASGGPGHHQGLARRYRRKPAVPKDGPEFQPGDGDRGGDDRHLDAAIEACGARPESGLATVAVAVLLAYEHSLVRPGDLRRLDAAFFTVNGVISIVFFGFVLLDVAA